MPTKFLLIDDTINPKAGEVFIDWNGAMVEWPGIQEISIKDNIQERSFKTVGTVKTQKKPTGVEGSGTMKINYYAVKMITSIQKAFRQTGAVARFNMIIKNEDASTSLGRRMITIMGCTLTGDIELGKLGTDDDSLTIDVNFNYDDFDETETFNDLSRWGTAG